MTTPGIKDRLGNVGNQFAITMILSFLLSLPVMIVKEGAKWGEFCSIWQTNPIVSFNLIASGLWFYGYNELATMTIKKTNAVTQSVANTAKRVIVIIGVAIVLKESLDPIKLLVIFLLLENFANSPPRAALSASVVSSSTPSST
eukprot:763822-Hanusia_phi.AAC.1